MAENVEAPPPFSEGEFRAAVADELTTLGYSVTSWENDGLNCLSPDGETRYLGLTNLRRRCGNMDAAEWPEAIRTFLRVLILTHDQAAQVPDDLADAADRLLVRLGQPFSGDAAPWSKKLPGTELVINLVIDSDQFMTYVTTEAMQKSNRPPGEWLDLALDNLRQRTPPDWLSVLHEESGILCGHCNDSYDAARALVLAELRDPGPQGWLLCIPTRDWLFCLPANAETLPHIHLLKILAEKNYQKEPYPISDQVYWVRGRRWQVFKVEIDEEGVRVYPSAEFGEALGLFSTTEESEPEAE